MADPDTDHGFVYTEDGFVDIDASPYFDVTPGLDTTVGGYIDRVYYQLAKALELQLGVYYRLHPFYADQPLHPSYTALQTLYRHRHRQIRPLLQNHRYTGAFFLTTFPGTGFVNFKLYHSINVKYPPILDPRLEALADELYALCRYVGAGSRTLSATFQESISSGTPQIDNGKIDTQTEESEVRLAQLQHQLPSNEPGTLMHLMEVANGVDEDQDTKECKSLFKNFKFFLSREVPRESLLFVIPAFGGMVSWECDGSFGETDEGITHQIVDRPSVGHKFLSREYVQPQWIYDCVNARIVLPTELYLVGRVPPPHLSPFVDNEAEGYVPEYAETVKRLQAAARRHVLPLPGISDQELDGLQSLLSERIIERTEANEAGEHRKKMELLGKQHLDDLYEEFHGVADSETPVGDTAVEGDAANELDQIAEDECNLSKISLSRKQRGIMEAIQIGNERKKDENELLNKRKISVAEANKSG